MNLNRRALTNVPSVVPALGLRSGKWRVKQKTRDGLHKMTWPYPPGSMQLNEESKTHSLDKNTRGKCKVIARELLNWFLPRALQIGTDWGWNNPGQPQRRGRAWAEKEKVESPDSQGSGGRHSEHRGIVSSQSKTALWLSFLGKAG